MKDKLIPRTVKITNWIALSTSLSRGNCCGVCESKIPKMAIIIRWNCFKFSAYRWVHMSCVEEMLKSKSFLAQGYPTSKCSWCDTKINETEVIRFADVAYIHKDCVKHVVDAVYKIREQYGPILMAREI